MVTSDPCDGFAVGGVSFVGDQVSKALVESSCFSPHASGGGKHQGCERGHFNLAYPVPIFPFFGLFLPSPSVFPPTRLIVGARNCVRN